MGMLDALNISASGMTAQRLRMDVIAQNMANVNTTRGVDGEPYRRKTLVFEEKGLGTFQSLLSMASQGGGAQLNGNGVKVTAVVEDYVNAMKKVYDPSHPDSDEDGYVTYPNVDSVTEMTNLISASRSYEANVTAFNATKNMLLKGLELGK